jgi:hypothetical protein
VFLCLGFGSKTGAFKLLIWPIFIAHIRLYILVMEIQICNTKVLVEHTLTYELFRMYVQISLVLLCSSVTKANLDVMMELAYLWSKGVIFDCLLIPFNIYIINGNVAKLGIKQGISFLEREKRSGKR